MMASVSGILILIVLPLPTWLWTSIVPLIFSILCLDHVHPNAPARDIGDGLCCGEPGCKDQVE